MKLFLKIAFMFILSLNLKAEVFSVFLENDVVAIYCHASDYAGRSAVNFFLKINIFVVAKDLKKMAKKVKLW